MMRGIGASQGKAMLLILTGLWKTEDSKCLVRFIAQTDRHKKTIAGNPFLISEDWIIEVVKGALSDVQEIAMVAVLPKRSGVVLGWDILDSETIRVYFKHHLPSRVQTVTMNRYVQGVEA